MSGYTFYNANPQGNNVTDCFIRSLSTATNRSWDSVYDEISHLARINATTMDDKLFIISYLDRHFTRMPKFHGTIRDASHKYKNDILLITTPGHIVCSKYGTIYDTWDSSLKEVEYIWLIKS